ncbi:shikimate transporter [Salmonella enterica subsp. enterica]|nr:shikimate transporter [Salmonella enterica subsp. enterica]EAW1376565.1 shikimate transporter [Salmonella enterica subsp. enterica]EBQ0452535.1 shikimate transporter [Salmonella enterica subsp. enterica]EBQ0468498.1 shikimate transporter [Salmonella enterica subsp. enterica]EBQ0488171.1 shikimate transporter [Salmonella enterica subsp. enterica]
MSVVISGALIDGAGIPMSGCHIILKSRVNTSEVVMRTVADVVTGNCGEYCFKAQTGKYCVYLKQDWRDEYCVGDISVYDDSRPGTLNDFLTALDEGDLKPDVVKRFEEMVAQAQQSAEAAAESEQQAGQHVADAQKIKADCQTLADNVQQNAEDVAEDKKQVALLASSATQDAARAEQAVKDADAIVQKAVDKLADAATLTGEVKASAEAAAKSEQNAKSHADNAAGSAQQTAQDVTATETARDDAERFAENARQDAVATAEDRKATAEDVKSTEANAAAAGQSAQDAAGYAHAAEQAKNDIDVTLAGTLKTVNHLSEIAAAGTEAQQESRDNLGLKSAATMEPQNDTHDRTADRLAVPGMFGFGKVFSSSDRIEFKTEADFLRWVKTAKPGRYVVYGADKVIPRVLFSGTVEIIWPEPQTNPNPAYVPKIIIFYGINGHIYYNRYWTAGDGYLVGWENLKVNEASLRALIETRAPLNSPALTGTPSTPTPPDDAAGNEIANAAFVRKLLAALVDSSPEALDTLNELAAALGHDPNFATTITNALAGKQPLNDVLTAVSQITPEENTLPYFSAEGRILLAQLSEKARALLALDTPEAMRTELELKAAATMEPQTDIRDRTPGRLALPGAFGFGKAFSNTEALTFNGQADFAEWLKEAMPERYAVSIADSSTLLAGTTKFNGIIDVMWSPFDNDESDTTRKFKTAVFYNQYYEGEHSIHRLTYRWSGNNWNATVSPVIYDGDSLAFLLSRTAGNGPSSYYKYPAVGSLILAVYQGTAAGDKAIKIGLGDIVPGSRLGPVSMSCTINDAGSYVSSPQVNVGGAGAYNFPGRYQALSGTRVTYGDRGFLCLFVRIE